MADTKRLLMLKALTTYLSTEITVANGYNYTLTDHVFRGKLFYGEKTPLPAVSILDALNPDRFPRRAGEEDQALAPDHSELYVLLIQGWVEDDPANPTDPAHNLMGDVKKALAKLNVGPHPIRGGVFPNYRLGGLVTKVEIEPGTVRPPDDLSAKAYFYLRAAFGFYEDLSDPFSVN